MSDYQEMVAESENVRAYITPDDDAESPREGFDNGIMACKHRNYNLGDYEHPMTAAVWSAYDRLGNLALVGRWLRMFHGATVVLPLGLIDHSGISMWVGSGAHWCDPGGWDSGTVGIIFDTAETREITGCAVEDIEEALRGEVEEYDRFLTGDVWGYVVERRETWTNTTGQTRDSWELVDSCWGFIGSKYATEEAQAAYDDEIAK